MTISLGWSLDVTALRNRLAGAGVVALALAFLLSFVAPQTTLGADGYDAASDPYSLFNVTDYVGAQAWWQAGWTGAGVDVALIDSGVSPVQGLDGSNKLVYGPDLSLESQASNLRHLDTFGHGTAMAGLIAGNDAAAGASGINPTVYRGIAPDARIVSIKVATADGGTDVSQVIAAIDWVVQHRTDNGLNIRVLNLSYGTNSTQPYQVDPLAYAAEQAWKHGIVVVAAAGNSGYQRGRGAPGLASPAYDPYLIAVGASTRETLAGDDYVASYSASGPGCGTCRNPSLVAPGSHLQLLRTPGSFVDQSLASGQIFGRYFRGSGTSEAAAIVSGAAALVLQRYPGLTPDQVKKFLQADTKKIHGTDERAQGKGRIELEGLLPRTPVMAIQWLEPATGIGSLETSRGDDHLTLDNIVLTGERDIFGHAWNAPEMTALEAAAAAWSGGTYNGNAWTGEGWTGSSWSGSSWSGSSWSGSSWSGSSWSGSSWSGSSWSGSSWSGSSWSGSSWSGSSWSGSSWSGNSWSGSSWD